MHDGAIVFSTELDNKELEKQLSGLKRKIDSTQDKISQKQAERFPLAEQSKQLGAQLDAAKSRLEYMKSGEKFFTSFSIREQEASIKATQKEWDKVQTRVERYDDAISRSTIELNRNKEKAGMIAQKLGNASGQSLRMNEAMESASKSAKRFALRLREVIRSALIFTLITQALAKLREWTGKVIQTNAEASKAVSQLSAALLTLAQPLMNYVIPAFTAFVRILTAAIMQMARLISFIAGTTIDQSQKSAKALNEQTEALDATGSAAKKAGKQLAAFDDINQINSATSGASGARGGNGISPDFDALGEFSAQEYKDKVDEITIYMSGALLALGAILTFSGVNIPLGISLMAIGAVGLVAEVKENWYSSNDKIRGAMNAVLLTLGTAMLVLGAIFVFSGANLPIGIGLMLSGAMGLGTAANLNWNSLSLEVKSAISPILVIIGAATLVFGAIFALTGVNIPLGIGLMISGALALGTAATLNWDSLSGPVRVAVTTLLVMIGDALLVIGGILAFSGVNIPLGIALISSGALSLVTAAVLNWNSIVRSVSNVVTSILAVLGSAFLVLGVLLCLSGVNIPLGIALISAGAASLVTAGALNWNAILDRLKGVWAAIKSWWAANVSPKLTLSFWQEQFSNIAEGLSSRIKSGVNAAIFILNTFINWVNKHLSFSWDAVPWLGIQSGTMQLVKLPNIPMLAEGAVIPPNREFLAMLGDQKSGTNIEAPLSTMVQAFKQAASEMGGSRPLTIIMELNGREFGRAVYQANNDETQRVGVRFAT